MAFVYDGGEAWYRNSVIRDRVLPASGYLDFMQAYDTFNFLAIERKIDSTMYNNSGGTNISQNDSTQKIIQYQHGEVVYIDNQIIEKVIEFDRFRLRIENLRVIDTE